MKTLYTLIIRLILSVVLAFFLGRLFFKDLSGIKVFWLAGAMLALAYLFEYTKKRDNGGTDGN